MNAVKRRDGRMLKRYQFVNCVVEIRDKNLHLIYIKDKKEQLQAKAALQKKYHLFEEKEKNDQDAHLSAKKTSEFYEKSPHVIKPKESSTAKSPSFKGRDKCLPPSMFEKSSHDPIRKQISILPPKKTCHKRRNLCSSAVGGEFNKSKRPCLPAESLSARKSIVSLPFVAVPAKEIPENLVNQAFHKSTGRLQKNGLQVHSSTSSTPTKIKDSEQEVGKSLCCVCQKVIDQNLLGELAGNSIYCSLFCICEEVKVITQMFNPFGRVKMVNADGLFLDDYELPMIEQLESFLCQYPNYIAAVTSEKRRMEKRSKNLNQNTKKNINGEGSCAKTNLNKDRRSMKSEQKISVNDASEQADTTSEHRQHMYDVNCQICRNKDTVIENKKQRKKCLQDDHREIEEQVVCLENPRRPPTAVEKEHRCRFERNGLKMVQNVGRLASTADNSLQQIISTGQNSTNCAMHPCSFLLGKKKPEKDNSEHGQYEKGFQESSRYDSIRAAATSLNDDKNMKNRLDDHGNVKRPVLPEKKNYRSIGSALQTPMAIMTKQKITYFDEILSSQKKISTGKSSAGVFSWGRRFNFSCSFVGLSNDVDVGLHHEKLVSKLLIKVIGLVESQVVWDITHSLRNDGCEKQIVVMLLEPSDCGNLGKNSSLAREARKIYVDCAKWLNQNGKFGVLDMAKHEVFTDGFIFSWFGEQKFPYQLKELARSVQVAKDEYKIFLLFIQQNDCNNDALVRSTAGYEANVSHVVSVSSNGSVYWNSGMNDNFRSAVKSNVESVNITNQLSGVF